MQGCLQRQSLDISEPLNSRGLRPWRLIHTDTHFAIGLLFYLLISYVFQLTNKMSLSLFFHIKAWGKPKNLIVTDDDENPYNNAKISWEQPLGTNCFKLEIENNQTGVVTHVRIRSNCYTFESGVPGCTYTIRLYSGYNNTFYDDEFVSRKIVMSKPQLFCLSTNKYI